MQQLHLIIHSFLLQCTCEKYVSFEFRIFASIQMKDYHALKKKEIILTKDIEHLTRYVHLV